MLILVGRPLFVQECLCIVCFWYRNREKLAWYHAHGHTYPDVGRAVQPDWRGLASELFAEIGREVVAVAREEIPVCTEEVTRDLDIC